MVAFPSTNGIDSSNVEILLRAAISVKRIENQARIFMKWPTTAFRSPANGIVDDADAAAPVSHRGRL